ncbi:hypothetical protein AB4Z38_12320 [Arthrobacter sp. 2RAF6]|uniref:hypothetical protein n=1 Tax=Arthrobacter sp. 2RAF6 TaxID=3233002 RepID=UPI003F93F753
MDTPDEREGQEAHHCEADGRQHPKEPCRQCVEGQVLAYRTKEWGYRRNRLPGAERDQQDAGKRGEPAA